MLLEYIDFILGWILLEDLKDSMIGDLWEAHHKMEKQGKSKAFINLATIWNSILLVFASCQIRVERAVEKNYSSISKQEIQAHKKQEKQADELITSLFSDISSRKRPFRTIKGAFRDFGIIIACCDQDYMFAQGTCASIRHFLGDVPICLIIDGTFSVEPLRKAYGIHVINRNNVSNPLLRERSFGWGLTKMVAFWESPFKHFLFLDADTNVWGNVLKYANFEDYDVVIDKPRYEEERSDAEVNHFFFDTAGIEKMFPNFDWRKYRNQYFCTGVFFASRDIFTVEEYIEILDLNSRTPIFKFGEMGLLNFMLCRAGEEGRIKVGQASMQIIVPDFSQPDLKKRFPIAKSEPVVNDEDVVIHWCGPKPTTLTLQAYSDPMTFSRRKFFRDSFGASGLAADLLLKVGDVQHYVLYYKNKMRKKWRLATKFLINKRHFNHEQVVSLVSPQELGTTPGDVSPL